MSAFESGYAAADPRVHASRPTVSGRQAVCGAGRIVAPSAGRFDPAERDACPACGAALTAVGQAGQ